MASANDIFAGIMGLLITIAYMGTLAWLAYAAPMSPTYQADFTTFLNWSVVPGVVWGFYFGRAAGAMLARRQIEELERKLKRVRTRTGRLAR
jgi:hypothetical protein